MSRKELSTSFNTRQHMEKRDYELFYYSDVRLDRISSHRHGYYEVYFFLEGSVDFQAGGSTRRLQYGDFLLLPPGVSHRPSIDDPDTPYRRFVLWLDPDFCLQLTRISPDLMYGFQASAETGGFFYRSGRFPAREIQARFIDLLEETKAVRVFSSTNATLKIASLLMRLNQIAYDALHPASPSVDGDLCLNLCDYIGQHLEEDLSLEALASYFYASKYHISHVFKDYMGISLHQYILKKRLQACKNGILSGIPFKQLIYQYGFHDYSSFYRAFKKEFGQSPGEFREHSHLPGPTPAGGLDA